MSHIPSIAILLLLLAIVDWQGLLVEAVGSLPCPKFTRKPQNCFYEPGQSQPAAASLDFGMCYFQFTSKAKLQSYVQKVFLH